jgi:hypothetical protein
MSNFFFSNLYFVEYTLGAGDSPHNIRSQAVSLGWNGSDPVHVVANITGNRGSTSTGSYAVDTGSPYPSGSIIEINNSAIITGRGGNGGNANGGSGYGSGPGLYIQYPTTLKNNGTIQGGGNGGNAGGGGSSSGGENQPPIYYSGGGGGGGAGYPGGSGGSPNGGTGSISAGGSGGGGYGGGAGSGSPGAGPGSARAITYGPGQSYAGSLTLTAVGTIYGAYT